MNATQTLDPPPTKGDSPVATFDWYEAPDLAVRRRGLGLTAADLATLVGRAQQNINATEKGHRPVSDQLMELVRDIESRFSRLEDSIYDSALRAVARRRTPTEKPITLRYYSEDKFREAHPYAATEHAPFPRSLFAAAVGRAAARLEHEGYIVSIKDETA